MNQELTAGSTLSHYRIVAKIGAGGMGEVYLAQDTKLDRRVALKILPADVASNRDRMERFVREAKSAATLNHPNIAHVYEIGESDGTHYIAMEFIDGDTLRHMIHRDKAPLPKLLKYLIQVAQGLSKAHAAGIVHRDLKPENIMITRDDYAKVLDFGLAKLVEPQRTFGSNESGSSEIATAVMQQHSMPGTVMGTVGYMSPEQASGRINEIDHRSDIFSFGCILFEAATGTRAFDGKDALDSLHKIVHAPTPQLKDANPLAPADLQRVVRRCLAKEREKRYQSIKELAIELDDLQQELKGLTESEYSRHSTPATSASSSGTTRRDEGFRIAVLPFKVRDDDPAVEILADGLSEEIGTGLSRFRYLSVVTNTSAVRQSGEIEHESSLGAKLGSRYVLEGSIRKGGSSIRVSAQLVDTETGAQLWSETYNRDLQTSTIFDVQDDVAGRIVATVADSYGVLVHSMRAAIRKKDDADLSPVEWQFQYFAYREQITPVAHAALKSRLVRGAKRDEWQSDLWACLAQIYVDEYAFGFQDDATSLDRALAAGRRGVELDRSNQFALVALAQVHFFRRDLAAFGPAAERAMTLNPLNTDALGILGLQIVHTGEFERGTAIVRRAMELNPNHAGWMHFAPLWDHFHKGEYEQALKCANRVDVPGLFWPFLVMASACGHLGRRVEAEAAVRDLLALDPEFAAHARSNVGTWHFASGLMGPILDGLRKAGLSVPATDGSSDSGAKADREESSTGSAQVRADEGFWVAVLPFKYSGANADLTALADGLSEDIVTGLSRFSYLRVIARSSTSSSASEAADARAAGKAIGARYVMEGSVRQAGAKVRFAVQLVDTTTGANLWAETYDRAFNPEAAFELQDDLVPRIVSTCGDRFGVLARSISDAVRGTEPGQLGPYEALMRAFGYHQRLTPVGHADARDALERAVDRAPSNADCWAMLSWIYSHEHAHGFNVRPGSLDRALAAARRAVDIAPSNPFVQQTLAVVLFFRKETAGCLSAAERAIALNPLDTSNEAMFLISFNGDWDRGCALIRRAMELNPHHPRWYELTLAINEYRLANYRGAIDAVVKANAPEVFWGNLVLAAAYGQLGELAAARQALRDLLVQKPDFGQTAPELLGKWMDPQLVEHLIEGLRNAGLEINDEQLASTSSASSLSSSETRSDEGFWVAVLPFKFTGSNPEVATLAEGLSEEVVTGLSRFSYLRVISRSSTLRYANEADDVRAVGKRRGARYVMEGSLRLAGSSLRVSVQLVDSRTGAHLWAETYDRQFRAEELFALQDDLVPMIVSTIADVNGVLPRSMSEVVCSKNPDELSPYEAVLRSFRYFDRVTPEELAAARSCLEVAVKKAPTNADAWAMLALLFVQDYGQGFNLHSDALNAGAMAAQRAVEAGPSNHLAHFSLAQARFFQKDFQSFRNAAERAVALNPMDGNSLAFMGELLTYVGDWERGLALASRAKEINPNHPGWFWYADFFHAYRQGDYRGALSLILKTNLPGHWGMHAGIAAAAGQLGERELASKAVRDLLKLRPNYGATVHNTLAKWFDPELCEQLLDGLRKAGLEIVGEEPALHHVSTESLDSNATSKPIAVPGFEGRPAIAVLPFDNRSNDPEQEYLADGLAEDLITRLSLWRSFPVIARNSSFVYKGKAVDVKKVSADLGVRYVVEGSVRKAGNRVRISAQLIDSTTGQNVWAKTYDRELTDVFAVQDEISGAIAASLVSDLQHAEHERVQYRAPENLEAWDLYQRALPLIYRFTHQDSARARALLERAIALDPKFSTARARLAEVGVWDFIFGWSDSPQQTLDAAVAQARRAVDLDRRNAEARSELAFALMTAGFGEEALEAARHGLDLNPCMPFALIVEGYLRNLSGNPPEESIKLMERAQQLSPHDPTEFLFYDILSASYMNAGRYAEGLAAGRRLVALMPNYYWGYLWSAMNAVGLGRLEEARDMIGEARRVHPGLSLTMARQALGAMAPEVDHRFFEALRQAGLEDERDETTREGDGETRRKQSAIRPERGDPQTVPGFGGRPAIAVLPFENRSNDPEQEYFADGLAEDLINRLSLWRSFPVIARNSSFAYKGDSIDLKKVSSELGVRYVVQGSVRKSGSQVRISGQLIDSTTGQNVWARTYDRELTDVFAVQDEISEAIAASLIGDLQRVEYGRAQRRAPENLEAWLLYQRALPHIYRFTREDSAEARNLLERSIVLDSQFSTAHARLSELGFWDYLFMWTDSPQQTLDTAVAQARRAVDLDSRDAEARAQLGLVLLTAGFGEEALEAARRGLDLNPSMPFALLVYAYILHMTGHPADESIELTKRAMRLSPQDPAEFLFYDVLSSAYLNAGKYLEGLATGRRLIALLPGYYWGYLWSAMNAVGLDQMDDARAMILEARRIVPELSITMVRQALGAMAPEVDRHFSDALLKAGLPEVIKETISRTDEKTRRHGDRDE